MTEIMPYYFAAQTLDKVLIMRKHYGSVPGSVDEYLIKIDNKDSQSN